MKAHAAKKERGVCIALLAPLCLGEGFGGAGLESLAAIAFFVRNEADRSPFESHSVQPGFHSQPGS